MNKEKIDALERWMLEQPYTPDNGVPNMCVIREAIAELREHQGCHELLGQKLAACSCAAIMDTKDSYASAKIDRDSPFWSPAYEDVRRRTAECITLRKEVAELRSHKEQVRCGGCRFGDDYGDSKGKCKCDLDYGWHTNDWYCADAEAANG